MSIACIGNGFVGGSLTTVFSERKTTVYTFDASGKRAPGGEEPNKTRDSYTLEEFVSACERYNDFSRIYFVCVPTPMMQDGSCDLSIVEDVLNRLANINGDRIAVVKSTIPPGTTERFNKQLNQFGLQVVFNPEYLSEHTALQDFRNQDRIILGGNKQPVKLVKHIYQSVFRNTKIVCTTSSNAEMSKYVANCFLATKVSFANEMYQICDALSKQGVDIDYDDVVDCVVLDKRVGETHWKVPSFESDDAGNPLFGFSLSCFPKDINALICLAKQLGVDPKVLLGAWNKNLEVRPGQDWNGMLGRAVSKRS